MIWREISNSLEFKQAPVSLEALMAATNLSEDYINNLFGQSYYQRYYGFRRFDTLEAFKEWATSTGVLYNPALHDRKVEQPAANDDDEEFEDEDEE
jgi:hypothetical protein